MYKNIRDLPPVRLVIHALRNPHGINEIEMRTFRHDAADYIEHYKEAYENMRQFAIDNGLDVTVQEARDAR